MATAHELLKIEISKAKYFGMTDDQIVASIISEDTDYELDMSSSEVRNALIFTANRDWAKLNAVVNGWFNPLPNQATRLLAVSVWDLLAFDLQFNSKSNQKYNALLSAIDSLIVASIMSTEGKNNLVALARTTRKLHIHLGFEILYAEDIRAARKL